MFINQNKRVNNEFFMELALAQAQKNLGNTKENPSVGCVLVKNGHLIAAGYTGEGGRPHAEQNAINFSQENPCKSELYVTLEPCSHYGKTPPCVKLIIKNKIKKVFFSINDPDIRSFNKCSSVFKKKGIVVSNHILKNKVDFFYRSYIKNKKDNLPFVTCKLAASKDFFTINKKGKWITNELSRGRVHLMRSFNECIITSSKTIMNDNPRLTCRINGLQRNSPCVIILDRKLKINTGSRIIRKTKKQRVIIFYNETNNEKIQLLKKLKIKTYKIALDKSGNLDLNETLVKAKKLGFSRIFIEAGIILTNSFLKKGLVDDFKLFVSNKALGKNGSDNIKKFFRTYFKNKKGIVEKVNLSGDKLMSYKIK